MMQIMNTPNTIRKIREKMKRIRHTAMMFSMGSISKSPLWMCNVLTLFGSLNMFNLNVLTRVDIMESKAPVS